MTWSVFDSANTSDHMQSLAFLDPNGGVTIQRYDKIKYRYFDKLFRSQRGFFWQPEEVDLTKDSADYRKLSPHAQHIFKSNLMRQILLDSVQGRSPNIALLPIASLPEIEIWIQTWAFSETIHSDSYTHIIRNVYSDPSIVFDGMKDIAEIVACANDITKNYDELIEMSAWYKLLGEGTHIINGRELVVDLYELKKSLWLTLMSVNILEGIRFYVSFACSFAFGELKHMEGNAKIIKLICRDENLHLAGTQMLLKTLPKDDPDYVKISQETREASIQMFKDAVQQEKEWAKYLFKDGSIIGLNEQLLSEYVDYIAHKRMASVGLPVLSKAVSNPLPWTQKWISGSEVQVAPQEVEKSEYIIGGTTQDVDGDTFKGFSL